MIDIQSFNKIYGYEQFYSDGDILELPNSDYVLLRISGARVILTLYGPDTRQFGTYAIMNLRTGRVVCTREIYDYDLKVLGYIAENKLPGDFANVLHYDGGARLTEYMNRVRIQRILSSQILQLL